MLLFLGTPGYSEAKILFINKDFKNITIQDFETNSDKLIINLENGKNRAFEGLGTIM